MYYGDHATDAVVRMSFSTTIQGVPTAPDTALEEADFRLYKDGSTSALTLTAGTITPAQYVAGANLVSVDTGNDLDIVAGADYTLVLDPSPETLGGGDFGGIVGSFSIENRYSAGALRPTVAGRTLDVSAGGEAGIDWANVGSPTTAVDLSATDIQLADTVTTLQGHTAQTGDSFARIGATGSGLTTLSTAAALATAQTDLNTITGTDGVTLATAQALYAPAKATDIVSSGAITTAGGAVSTVTTVGTTTTNTDMRGTDSAALASVCTEARLSELDAATGGKMANQVDVIQTDTTTDIPAELTAIKGATFSGATDSLEAIRDRGDAAWTTGAGGSAPTVEEIRAEIDTNSTQLALIVADTNELQLDWANAGRLDTILDSRMAEASINTTAGAVDTVTTNTDMRGTDDAATALGLAIVASSVGNIETDTNELQLDWANGGRLDVILDARMAEASINTTAGAVDTVTTNSDMRGTDSAATAAALATAQLDLDTLTGTDGVTLATAQALYAPAKAADVNAQVLDVLVTDTFAEPAAVPAATASLKDKIGWLFTLSRNKLTQTATTQTLRNDADGADIAAATVSDDATTATRGEFT